MERTFTRNGSELVVAVTADDTGITSAIFEIKGGFEVDFQLFDITKETVALMREGRYRSDSVDITAAIVYNINITTEKSTLCINIIDSVFKSVCDFLEEALANPAAVMAATIEAGL